MSNTVDIQLDGAVHTFKVDEWAKIYYGEADADVPVLRHVIRELHRVERGAALQIFDLQAEVNRLERANLTFATKEHEGDAEPKRGRRNRQATASTG